MVPEFADILNDLLQEADRSASWLARRLEVYPSTVSRWLDGSSHPDSIVRVEEILEIVAVQNRQTRASLLNAYRYWVRSRKRRKPRYAAQNRHAS